MKIFCVRFALAFVIKMKVGFHELMPDGRGRFRSGRVMVGASFWRIDEVSILISIKFYIRDRPRNNPKRITTNWNKFGQIEQIRTRFRTVIHINS